MNRSMLFAALSVSICFSLLLSVIPTGSANTVLPVTSKSLKRQIDTVTLPGTVLNNFHGKRINDLQLYACTREQWVPIPFQIDEFTEQGERVLTEGPGAEPEKRNRIIDPQDRLIFHVQDIGDRVLAPDWLVEEAKGLEIEIREPGNKAQQGWCYLFLFEEGRPTGSLVSYVNYDAQQDGYNWNEYYEMQHLVDKRGHPTLAADRYRVPLSSGGDGKDFLHRLKFRIGVVLFFGRVSVKVNEESLGVDVLGYQSGPVRSVERTRPYMKLPLGLKGPRFVSDVIYLMYGTLVPSHIHLPVNPGLVLTRLEIRFTYDLDPHAYGMLWYNSNNQEGFLVDGRTSPQEQGLNPARDQWRLWTGPQGTLMLRSIFNPKFAEQAQVQTHYLDDIDESDPPETQPGQISCSGAVSRVKSLEPGNYHTYLVWYFPPHFYERSLSGLDMPYIQEFLDELDNPLEIVVSGQKIRSNVWPVIPQ